MTYPITPAPNIHTDPTAQSSQQQQLAAEKAALQQMFAGLIPKIIELIVNAIVHGVAGGVGTVEGVVKDGLTDIVSFFEGLGTDVEKGVSADESIAQMFVTAGVTDITAFIKWLLGLFKVLNVGALSSNAPNQMINPTFTADAIYGSPDDWSVDMTSSRTNDGSGSGLVIADGLPHALITGATPSDIIPVGQGQNFPVSIYLSHSGAAVNPGGPTVILWLYPYNGTTPLAPVQLDSYTPAVADLPWPGQQLTGTYEVPPGVDGVQAGPAMTTLATQGVYRFDDGSATQASDMSVVPNLIDTLQTMDNSQRALMDGIASVAQGFPIVGAEISDVIHAFENFIPANISGSTGEPTLQGDIQSFINHMFGAATNQAVDPNGTTTLAQLYTAMNAALHNTSGSDVTQFVDTTTTVSVDPTWANYLDVIGVGAGQAGGNGLTLGFDGQGGQAGVWNMVTWALGTDYTNTLTAVTVTVNGDGSITATIPGKTITFAAGSGNQSPHFGSGLVKGIGPGSFTYNGKSYTGGGNQNTPGAAGLGPGGGGAGGNGLWFQKGGPGAPGGVWVRARSAAVSSPSTGADTTAPSAPTPHFVSATMTSVTISASGSVDS